MVKWIEDGAAKSVLRGLGIETVELTVPLTAIDFKASKQNCARLSSSLDKEHVDSLTRGIIAGDEIPMPVLRRMSQTKFVILGGNHRLAAMQAAGVDQVVAHVIICGEAEAIIAAQQLNLQNGKNVSTQDRVAYAANAIAMGVAKTTTEAGAMFRVSRDAIARYIREQKAEEKVVARSGKRLAKIPIKTKTALAEIQSDQVFQAALELVEQRTLSRDEVCSVLKDAMGRPSEAEQLQVIRAHQLIAPERKISSPYRKTFLVALAHMEVVLANCHNMQSMDIIDDAKEVRERCQIVAKYLKSL